MEKQVKVVTFMNKEIAEIGREIGEVDYDVAFVFPRRKLFDDKALPDTSCAVDHERGVSAALLFPLQHGVINFTFQKH